MKNFQPSKGHVVHVCSFTSLKSVTHRLATDFKEQLKFQGCVVWPRIQHNYALSTDFKIHCLDVE